jgi:hypothetical protein
MGSLFTWRQIVSDPSNTFLSDTEVEIRWRRKSGYMVEQRARGGGPKFVRLSPRVVRYRLADLLEYEQRNTFSSNAEAMVAADDGPPEAA